MDSNSKYRQYAEAVALQFEQAGFPRTAGRIFGWLLIADPPYQTMNDLVDGLQISKSSVSTATRLLIQIGLIQRLSLPGERRDYFLVVDNVWQTNLQQQQKQLAAFRQLAEEGLALLVDQAANRRHRLQEMRDFYAFLEKEFPALLVRWEASRSANNTQKEHP